MKNFKLLDTAIFLFFYGIYLSAFKKLITILISNHKNISAKHICRICRKYENSLLLWQSKERSFSDLSKSHH